MNGKMIDGGDEGLLWFAMSATFGRALKVQSLLESKGVDSFVPMRYEMKCDKRVGKVRKLVPAINNLIFVHTTKERIQALKAAATYLQYHTNMVGGRRTPIVVPDEQMQQFMAVCNTHNEALQFLAPEEVDLAEGTSVKIVGGAFDGVVGSFVKAERGGKSSVVVQVEGITAVMIVEISDGYIQVLE